MAKISRRIRAMMDNKRITTAQPEQGKQHWKPGTLIYPLPAVLVSVGHTAEEYNMLTVAWTGTLCTEPPMCYISVRKERHSHDIIERTGEFVINLTTSLLRVPPTGAVCARDATRISGRLWALRLWLSRASEHPLSPSRHYRYVVALGRSSPLARTICLSPMLWISLPTSAI